MNWIFELHASHPVAHAIGALALVSLTGLAFGNLKLRGIGLGSAGVLFAGIVFGHFARQMGQPVDHHLLDFVREFGLVLFVFTIGLQLGPGFFASLRQQGLKLNGLAAAIVLSGAATAALMGWLLHIDFAAVLGLFSGATTNTPSLGAAQQALASLPTVGAERAALPALAYAVSYPLGITGIITSLLVVKKWFAIDLTRERAAFEAEQHRDLEPLERRTLIIENPNFDNVPLSEVPGRRETGVNISRLRSAGSDQVRTPRGDTVLHRGDTLLAVGTRTALDRFQRIIGRKSDEDLLNVPSQVTQRRVVVTHKQVLGKTVQELGLEHLHGVVVTRITRADLEMSAVPDLRLQFGDLLQIVGETTGLDRATDVLGNSTKDLQATHFIPLFTGIALGVLLGTLPFAFPGIPQPVRLGLAGGPLIIAILLSRIGHFGTLVWHMPVNTNLAFRELGITLFLAAVGITAGEKFFGTVFTQTGLIWLLAAAVITMLPLLVVAFIGRRWLKMNFLTLSGLMAGSMTDPPALAFAANISKSDAPSVSYATVYPLTMLLRILCGQGLALWLVG
ncbi:MAG TPA: putative transporter [Verrucomicrobiae bacterium]|nr:putative transporter [Verrucomicrobiae bacterium]